VAKFVLQKGTHMAFDAEIGARRKFHAGEVVDLKAASAKAFRDKFKSIEVVKAEAEVAEAQLATIKQLEADETEAKAKVKLAETNLSARVSPATEQKDEGQATGVGSPSGEPKSPSQSGPVVGSQPTNPAKGVSSK
jgi:hypothetical protein